MVGEHLGGRCGPTLDPLMHLQNSIVGLAAIQLGALAANKGGVDKQGGA